MTAVVLVGAILVTLLVLVFVVPLRTETAPPADLEELPPAERLEAALDALEEVEFDHETGKLPEEEYRRLRSRFGRIAVAARRDAGGRAAGPSGGADEGREARGESGEPGAEGRPGTDAVPPAEAGSAPCPSCGARTGTGARYCSRCGYVLAADPG